MLNHNIHATVLRCIPALQETISVEIAIVSSSLMSQPWDFPQAFVLNMGCVSISYGTYPIKPGQAVDLRCHSAHVTSQIARFMGPTWGPPGSCRPQVGPMLAPWTLLSGIILMTSMLFSGVIGASPVEVPPTDDHLCWEHGHRLIPAAVCSRLHHRTRCGQSECCYQKICSRVCGMFIFVYELSALNIPPGAMVVEGLSVNPGGEMAPGWGQLWMKHYLTLNIGPPTVRSLI